LKHEKEHLEKVFSYLPLAVQDIILYDREEYASQLRRKSTAECIIRKRAKYSSEPIETQQILPQDQLQFKTEALNLEAKLYEAIQVLSTSFQNEPLLFGLIVFLRESMTEDKVITHVVKMNAVPLIVQLLANTSQRVCMEAVWTLNNIAASRSPYCNMLCALDVPKKLIGLLDDKEVNVEIKELVRVCVIV